METKVLAASRRIVYEPMGLEDQFIVPLLAHHIGAILNESVYASSPSALALDVGCGRQPFRELLETKGFRVLGLDTDQTPEGSVDFVTPIDGKLPDELLRLGGFDFLLCTEVLEHVADWPTAFRNMAVLLNPGGRLLITCPFFYPLHEEPWDYWRPTHHAFTEFAREHGFSMVQQVRAGNGWETLGTLVACLRISRASSSLHHRAFARLLRVAQRATIRICRWLRYSPIVRVGAAGMYLSNVCLMQKDDLLGA